jgi:hypothetical protein
MMRYTACLSPETYTFHFGADNDDHAQALAKIEFMSAILQGELAIVVYPEPEKEETVPCCHCGLLFSRSSLYAVEGSFYCFDCHSSKEEEIIF